MVCELIYIFSKAEFLLFGQERDAVLSLSLKVALLKHLPLLQDNKMTCLI